MNTVKNFKIENGCEKVFVDNTYSQPKYFPIYNDASISFLKSIFEDSKFSRFDDLIISTLKTKAETLKELELIYENEIDFIN